jgi:hypothetical protein
MSGSVEVVKTKKDFSDKFCTSDQAAADPTGSKDKMLISNDAFATGEALEAFSKELAFRIGRFGGK